MTNQHSKQGGQSKPLSITIQEKYFDNGQVDVQIFTSFGENVTAKYPQFIQNYKNRIKTSASIWKDKQL